MADPRPSADPKTRFRVGCEGSRHIYDTWQAEQGERLPYTADKEVALTFDPALAPVIVEALNDREQARANAAADIHANAEQRIEDLRAEFERMRVATEKRAKRLMYQSVGGDVPEGMSWTDWMAVDVIARDLVRQAVQHAVTNGLLGTSQPLLEAAWNLIERRAVALVEPHPDPVLSNAEQAAAFLVDRAGSWPALPEVTHG